MGWNFKENLKVPIGRHASIIKSIKVLRPVDFAKSSPVYVIYIKIILSYYFMYLYLNRSI